MSNLSRPAHRRLAEPPESLLQRAEDQFATGAFWEAHETLEPLWLALAPGPASHRVRAIIQLAAALHKSRQPAPSTGRRQERGLLRVLQRARDNWTGAPEALPAPDALDEAFRSAAGLAERWARQAEQDRERGQALPPPIGGVVLPLPHWAAAVAFALAAVSSASDPERTR